MYGPSIKRMVSALNVSRQDAKKIKRLMNEESAERTLKFADKAMEASGVESIRNAKLWDRYYHDTALLYVNVGDTYVTTLYFDVERMTFGIGCYGDWLEKAERCGRYKEP